MVLNLTVAEVIEKCYAAGLIDYDMATIFVRNSAFCVIGKTCFCSYEFNLMSDLLDYRVDSFTWEPEGKLYIDIDYPYFPED